MPTPPLVLTVVLLVAALLPTSAAPLPATAAAAPAAAAAEPRQIGYAQWTSGADFRSGRLLGVRSSKGRVTLKEPTRQRRYDGRRYDMGTWISPWVASPFDFTELVASWVARTPRDSWIEVQVRGRDRAGSRASWDTLARWAAGDRFVRRTTVSGQSDDLADVNVDTWRTSGLAAWQLRVRLMRKAGATRKSPRLESVGAMTSRLPPSSGVTASTPRRAAAGVVLDVPRYSQMVHQGHYPAWGNGGEAWCAPTSTSMVLGYYDALPPAKAWSWVPDGHEDPWVDLAARSTYDAEYEGTGNWPFNTAYAGTRTGEAFVTRLRSLREAEKFILAGIPVIASIAFGSGELGGTPISASNGHLLVIVGFTADGDVVVNDPAARERAGVRRTYDRGEFENAWLPKSGGLVFIVTDRNHPLPESNASNW
ncbi:C39 family peptidase [Nocardioides sp.]|uniref:C39 family peptidase n=1 Tax=Nocardioides sp. TaxID=35761 RepID=UPI003566E978